MDEAVVNTNRDEVDSCVLRPLVSWHNEKGPGRNRGLRSFLSDETRTLAVEVCSDERREIVEKL